MKFLLLLVLVTSCATTKVSQSGLYWGDYSKTLYEYKKNPSKDTLAKHKNELMKIISKSKELNLRPPPGIQAELGMILTNENDEKSAMNHFNSEAETYPESRVIITKIKESFKPKQELK